MFGFLLLFLSTGKKLLWSESLTKSVMEFLEKYDLLFFVDQKNKDWGANKLKYLDAARMIFGSAIQFIFQLWVLRAALYFGEARLSQYFSVFSSILFIRYRISKMLS